MKRRADPPGEKRKGISASYMHRVTISELDPYHHANHCFMLKWLEEGRERLLRAAGTSFLDLFNAGQRLVLVNLDVDFRGSAAYGDEVGIVTFMERIGRTSVVFGHLASIGARPAMEGTATMVFIGENGKPIAVPEPFRRAIEGEGTFQQAESD